MASRPRFYSLLVLVVVPFLIFFYFSRADLILRLSFLLLAFIFAFFYDNFFLVQSMLTRVGAGLSAKAGLFFLILCLGYAACAFLFVRSFPYLGGDEPHYLVMTQSLVEDGDLDLRNNYLEKTYLWFHPAPLDPHTHYQNRSSGWWPIHSPGLAVLLVPAYLLIRGLLPHAELAWIIGSFRLFMALFGLLLFLLLRHWLRQLYPESGRTMPLLLLLAFTSPFLFYSLHLFPEMIAALLGFGAYVTLGRQSGGRTGYTRCAFFRAGLLLSPLIFFHNKYMVIQAGFFLALWLVRRTRFRNLLLFILPQFAMFLASEVFLKAVYGTFSPTQVYEGAQFSSWLTHIVQAPLFRRIETLLGYFLDQRDGLLPYAPVFLLALFALTVAGKERRRENIFLSLVAGPYILYYAILTTRGAYSPPGRPLLAVIWVGAIWLADFCHSADAAGQRSAYSLGVLSLFFVPFILWYPQFLYQPTTAGISERAGSLFAYLSNLHLYFPAYLPSFLKMPNLGYLPNYVWLAVIVCLVWGFRRRKQWVAASLFALALAFILLSRVLFPLVQDINPRTMPRLSQATFYNLSGYLLPLENGRGFWVTKSRSQGFHFLFSTPSPLPLLKMKIGSIGKNQNFTVSLFDRSLHAGRAPIVDVYVQKPPFYRKGKRWYYDIFLFIAESEDLRTFPFIVEFSKF